MKYSLILLLIVGCKSKSHEGFIVPVMPPKIYDSTESSELIYLSKDTAIFKVVNGAVTRNDSIFIDASKAENLYLNHTMTDHK